ncbi:MAG: tetratricopeptide repeat protein [Candidatus Sabulitectum sp.]|nr:tetratricopeptide repeat protein [Candidatus Sabulitectum sp.]
MPHNENDIQDLYQKWLSSPTPALCVRLAGKLHNSDRNTEALEVARRGLLSWKDNISVNVIFGRCALGEKLADEAQEVFEKVVSIDPLNLIAIKGLAQIHFEQKNWDRAIELFEEYLFEYPGDPEVEEMLKISREKKNDAAREARETGQDVAYPETGRMASILAAQKTTEVGSGSVADNSGNTPKDVIAPVEPANRAPRSLLNLFTPEECEELGLSAYEK